MSHDTTQNLIHKQVKDQSTLPQFRNQTEAQNHNLTHISTHSQIPTHLSYTSNNTQAKTFYESNPLDPVDPMVSSSHRNVKETQRSDGVVSTKSADEVLGFVKGGVEVGIECGVEVSIDGIEVSIDGVEGDVEVSIDGVEGDVEVGMKGRDESAVEGGLKSSEGDIEGSVEFGETKALNDTLTETEGGDDMFEEAGGWLQQKRKKGRKGKQGTERKQEERGQGMIQEKENSQVEITKTPISPVTTKKENRKKPKTQDKSGKTKQLRQPSQQHLQLQSTQPHKLLVSHPYKLLFLLPLFFLVVLFVAFLTLEEKSHPHTIVIS
eukprot:TRINITY_DN4538_c0_g1_i4.p1 TRINITY_DN4538_c0_g1~~TRINITY_DN4538_c0_g1_i4.p1  ORF type:complete len:322 (+),score=100.60 TRINITY_DN4538_c0_g1_i4:1184-2149(+)